MISIIVKLIVDVGVMVLCVYIVWKVLRGYDVVIELKTTKSNHEKTAHNREARSSKLQHSQDSKRSKQ